jgi:hypothetical protein
VIWWKSISSDIEYPIRATVLEVNPKRVKLLIEDPEGVRETTIRHAPPERVHRVGRYFSKLGDQTPMMFEPMTSWGGYVQHTEVGEDLFAMRLVFSFDNGNFLSYDRSHWGDDFGTLGDGRINRNRQNTAWGRLFEIDAAEFEQVWASARSSPSWRRQVETEKMSSLGAVPIWLRIKLWHPPGVPRFS